MSNKLNTRELADRLRGGYDVVDDGLHYWLNGTLFGLDICARSEWTIRNGLRMIADLIDPKTSKFKDGVEMPVLCNENTLCYAHEGDAGMDIRASENAIIHKGEYKVVHTGLHIECPEGHVAYVMPRSGLAVKNGITVLNAPGVVDSGYRGEIVVPLINLGRETFEVSPGDRIAQLIISPYTKVKPYNVTSLSDSERGSYGLGSTGVK